MDLILRNEHQKKIIRSEGKSEKREKRKKKKKRKKRENDYCTDNNFEKKGKVARFRRIRTSSGTVFHSISSDSPQLIVGNKSFGEDRLDRYRSRKIARFLAGF